MRIRTDGEYQHRIDTIEAAAERLDCNKTKAVLIAREAVGPLLDNVEDALEHENLPPRIRNEMAEMISTRQVEVEITEVDVSAVLE